MTKKRTDYWLSRRDTLRLMGAAGAKALLGSGSEQSVVFGAPAPHGPITGTGMLPAVLRPALLAPSPVGPIRSAQTLDCVVRPALTEGPYFVDERLNRSDIRTDPSTNT